MNDDFREYILIRLKINYIPIIATYNWSNNCIKLLFILNGEYFFEGQLGESNHG